MERVRIWSREENERVNMSYRKVEEKEKTKEKEKERVKDRDVN